DRGAVLLRVVGSAAGGGGPDGPDAREVHSPGRRRHGAGIHPGTRARGRVLARGARVPRALRPPPDADRRGAPVRRGPGAAPRCEAVPGEPMTDRARRIIVMGVLAAVMALVIWLVAAESPFLRWLVRLYEDKHLLKQTVRSWGWMAPLVFIAIQALQVIISPIPGEVTGPVGGALFGVWWGVVYSTIGLTAGTLFCFWVGHRWGEPLVRAWLSEHNWNRMNFILEAEGAIICFILYLIPGFPKD